MSSGVTTTGPIPVFHSQKSGSPGSEKNRSRPSATAISPTLRANFPRQPEAVTARLSPAPARMSHTNSATPSVAKSSGSSFDTRAAYSSGSKYMYWNGCRSRTFSNQPCRLSTRMPWLT